MNLAQASTYHRLALGTAGKSPRTITLYTTYEQRFLDFLALRKIPATYAALNPANVRQAILWQQRAGRGKRGGAVAVKMFGTTMKVWAGWLYAEGILGGNPLARLPVPAVREIERQPYTRTEVLALLEATKSSKTPLRDRLLIHLLLDTGTRIGEITSLTVDRIRLEPPQRRITVIGKGNRERSIPFGDPTAADGGETVRLLKTYLREREAFFARFPSRRTGRLLLTKQGFCLSTSGAADTIRRLGQQAGVAEAQCHRFRHSFATIYLTQYPGDEAGLRAILGHVSVDVMRTYTHLSAATIAERSGRVSPSQNWLKEGRR